MFVTLFGYIVFFRGVRNDIDEEDDEESYYRYMEENPMAGILAEEEEELSVQYDDEGNAVIPDKKVTNYTRVYPVYNVMTLCNVWLYF